MFQRRKIQHLNKFQWQFGKGFLVLIFFLFIAGYLTVIAAKYTLIDHDFYGDLAEKQQIRTESSFVNRGTIYGANDISGDGMPVILSASAFVKALGIDPSQEGDREGLARFIADIVYQQLCQKKDNLNCFDNIQSYTQVYDILNFSFEKESIIEFLLPTIQEQVHRKYKTRIFLAGDVGPDAVAALASLENPGILIEWENIYVNPTKYDKTRSHGTSIATILDIPLQDFRDALKLRINRNVDIISKLDREVTDKVIEKILEEQQRVRDKELSPADAIYPFLKLEDHPVRIYPEGSIVSQVTWFVDGQNVWRYGIEWYFQEELSGKWSDIKRHKDALGRPIEPIGQEQSEEIQGINIYLTIDRNIQQEVMQIMKKMVTDFGANSGSAIVLDPKTWAVKAMVNYPTFDPERPGNVYNIERFRPGEYIDPLVASLGKPMFIADPSWDLKKTYQWEVLRFYPIKDEEEMDNHISDPTKQKFIYENGIWLGAYLNQSISSLYEPGSVFKSLTVAIGIDTGEIEPHTIYEDTWSLMIDNFEINNLDQEKCEWWQTFRNALNFSCNVGMVRIAQKIGKPLFHRYLQDFGIWERTGIHLDGEITGHLEPYEKWSRAKLFTTSFWQGIQVTLLQMAAAYGVLANGWVYMQPYIVDAREYPNGEFIKTTPSSLRRVITKETSKKVTAMMTEWVQVGFAKAGAIPGYDLAWKTGTSQIATKWVYEKGAVGRTITSFGWFGPSSDPKFVIVVKFDRPRNAQYSSDTSAVAFREISDYLLRYYNVPKGD